MIRWRSFAAAIGVGALLALLVTVLARLTATSAGLATCCLAFALYPLVGATYALICPRPARPLANEAVGGASSALAVLVWQFVLAVTISPTNPIESFTQGLSSAPAPYAGNPALIAFGLLFGFGVVLVFVAATGAIGALLSSLVCRRREDPRA